jgi:hypothetical protein
MNGGDCGMLTDALGCPRPESLPTRDKDVTISDVISLALTFPSAALLVLFHAFLLHRRISAVT